MGSYKMACAVMLGLVAIIGRLLFHGGFVEGNSCASSVELFTCSDYVVKIVDALRWSSVSFIMEDTTDFTDTLTDAIHRLNIQTVMSKETTMMEQCDARFSHQGGAIVLGHFNFVKHVFTQTARCANMTDQEAFLFTSEWLTIMAEDHLNESQSFFASFQNVAAIAKSKTDRLTLWTLLHAKQARKLTLVTSLTSPLASPLLRHRILPNLSYGLGGRTLRVVTKPEAYVVMRKKTEDGVDYSGMAMELLQELSHRLNFSYVFIPPTDDSWGIELANGQWDGPIGMLIRKEVDMAASSFTITPGRSSAADASTAFMYDTATVMLKPGHTAKVLQSWIFYSHPFQSLVYVAIAGCLLLASLLLLMLDKCQEVIFKNYKTEDVTPGFGSVGVGWLYRLTINVEILMAGLVKQPMEKKSQSRPGRVLVVAWLLVGVILASLYSSQLTSCLAVQKRALPFTSLAGLLNQNTYTWGFLGSASTGDMLKTSTNKQFQEFYKGTMKFARSDPGVMSSQDEEHLQKMVRGGYAFFTSSRLRYEMLAANHCDITVLSDVQFTSSFGFYLQKGSPYTRLINEEITKMFDVGLLSYWKRKWTPKERQCDPDDGEDSKVIHLADTQTAFYVSVLGMGLAVIVLIVERSVIHNIAKIFDRLRLTNDCSGNSTH